MKTLMKHLWVFRKCALLAAMQLCLIEVAVAQIGWPEEIAIGQDPTRASEQIKDVLKAQLAGLRAVKLKGIVMLRNEGGVALIESDEGQLTMVKANSQFSVLIAGVALKILVKEVSPAGVRIEAPTLSEGVWLPGMLDTAVSPPVSDENYFRHIELNEAPLGNVLNMLAEQCGSNYSVSASARVVPVSLFLRNVPLQTVVEELCKNNNLWFKRDADNGVIRIMTVKEFERDLISFHEEKDEVFTLLYPNVIEVAEAIRNLYGNRVQLILSNTADDDAAQDLSSRFQRFDFMSQRGLDFGQNQGQGLWGNTYGGGIGTTVIAGNNSTVWSSGRNQPPVYNFQQNYEQPPAPQSSLNKQELTSSQAQYIQRLVANNAGTNVADQALRAFHEMPASIFVTVIRRNNMIIVRTSDTRALSEIAALIKKLDVPAPMVLLEMQILSLEIGDGFESIFDYQINTTINMGHSVFKTTAGFIRGSDGSPGDIQPPAAGSSMIPGGSGRRDDFMSFQVVNDHFKARMQMLESKNKVKVLATPMLLTANNEVSRFFLGEERPLVRDVSGQSIISDTTLAVTPSTSLQWRPVGTTLLVTPNINSDRTVTLRLLQEDSTIKPGATTIPIIVGGGNVQQVSLDVVTSRSISGTFVAQDKMSVAVGGLISETTSKERTQVPLLGSIPYLGVLFRREHDIKQRSEIVIMIRPHVISTPAESAEISRALLKELSAHPVGTEGLKALDIYRDADNDNTKP